MRDFFVGTRSGGASILFLVGLVALAEANATANSTATTTATAHCSVNNPQFCDADTQALIVDLQKLSPAPLASRLRQERQKLTDISRNMNGELHAIHKEMMNEQSKDRQNHASTTATKRQDMLAERRTHETKFAENMKALDEDMRRVQTERAELQNNSPVGFSTMESKKKKAQQMQEIEKKLREFGPQRSEIAKGRGQYMATWNQQMASLHSGHAQGSQLQQTMRNIQARQEQLRKDGMAKAEAQRKIVALYEQILSKAPEGMHAKMQAQNKQKQKFITDVIQGSKKGKEEL